MIEYRKLEKAGIEKNLDNINSLYGQLSSKHKEINIDRLREVLEKKHAFVLGAFDREKLVGIGSLHIVQMIAGSKGLIEEVVVDENYRRQGIARNITQKLLDKGKDLRLKYADLTSRPNKEAANNLYKSLGFELRDTNCYRFEF